MTTNIIKKSIAIFMAALFLLPTMMQAINAEESMPSFSSKILSDPDIPKLLNVSRVKSQNHVARLKFEETDMYSAVFENSDGTRTMYISSDSLKYKDADGNICDKDLSITAINNGFAVEKTDTKLYFHDMTLTGVTVSNEGVHFSIYPSETSKVASIAPKNNSDKNTVKYNNVFSQGIDIIYTPISDGVKEDIVINRKNGVSSFSFIVETNGNSLIIDNNNQVYLTDEKQNKLFRFGDIYVYDSTETSTYGTYSVKTIIPNIRYELTISVDADYLANATYPVVVDPTVFCYFGNTKNILDRTVYFNNQTIPSGYATYNKAGNAGTFGTTATLIKIPGLYNSDLFIHNADSISSITLDVYCNSIGSSVSGVRAYAFTGSDWDEDNSPANISYSSNYTASGSQISGDVKSYRFNLSSILTAWKNGYANIEKGILLNTTNYTTKASLISFYSTDASSYRPYLAITYTPGKSNEINEDITYMFVNAESNKAMQSISSKNSNSLCEQMPIQYKGVNSRYFNTQLFSFEYWDIGLYYIKSANGEKLTYASTGNHLMTFSSQNNRDYQLWYIVKSADGYFHFVPFMYIGKSLSTGGSVANATQLCATNTTNASSNKWQLRPCLDVPLFTQAYKNTCGTACALMALNYLGAVSYTYDADTQRTQERIFANAMDDCTVTEDNDRICLNGNKSYVTYVYRIKNALVSYWPATSEHPAYSYATLDAVARNTYGNYTAEEKATAFADCIKNNIKLGYPVIAKAIIDSDTYFGYTSDGHYLLVVGYYETTDGEHVIINDCHYAAGIGKQLDVPMSELYHYVNDEINEKTGEYIISVIQQG